MKVKFEFDLANYDDEALWEIHNKAGKMSDALTSIMSEVYNIWKHRDFQNKETIQIVNEIYEFIRDETRDLVEV